jgi:hypothetical protein
MAFSFGAGLLMAIGLGFWPGRADNCRTDTLAAGKSPQDFKETRDLFGDWVRDARVCTVGEYLIIGPAKGGSSDIVVSRKGKAVFVVSKTQTQVVGEDRVLFERDTNRQFISFAAYDSAQRTWVDNIDMNADGTLDARIDTSEHATKREIRLGDRWLELVKRDGKTGTVINGKFMSIDEAGEALGVKKPLPLAEAPR